MTAVILNARCNPAPELKPPPHPFQELEGGYDLIMADPPWPYKLRSPKGEKKSYAVHYGSMPFEDIAALKVGELASRDCVLFLWCTWPLLFRWPDGQPIPREKIARLLGVADDTRPLTAVGHLLDQAGFWPRLETIVSPIAFVMASWGFRYATGGVWHKRTINGLSAFGTGYRARSACEPFLIAVKGDPKNSRSERNLIEGLAREHSRKPEEAYAWCERYLPRGRFLELFSRTSRPRWDTWGYEVGKFEPVVERQALGSAARGAAA